MGIWIRSKFILTGVRVKEHLNLSNQICLPLDNGDGIGQYSVLSSDSL